MGVPAEALRGQRLVQVTQQVGDRAWATLSIFPFLQQGVASLPKSCTRMSVSQPALGWQRQELVLWFERLRPRLEAKGGMEAIARPYDRWWLKELGEKLETRRGEKGDQKRRSDQELMLKVSLPCSTTFHDSPFMTTTNSCAHGGLSEVVPKDSSRLTLSPAVFIPLCCQAQKQVWHLLVFVCCVLAHLAPSPEGPPLPSVELFSLLRPR